MESIKKYKHIVQQYCTLNYHYAAEETNSVFSAMIANMPHEAIKTSSKYQQMIIDLKKKEAGNHQLGK